MEEYQGDPDDWEPTAREQPYIDLYAESASGSTKDTLAAMREPGQGIINDAHLLETGRGGRGSGGGAGSGAVVGEPQRVTDAALAASKLFGINIRSVDPGVAEDIARANPLFYTGGAAYQTNCHSAVNA